MLVNESDVIVSVVISIYNAEKYLRQCLESISKQTLRVIEIICVNDGSTDSSLEIIEAFAKSDKRFRVFTKKNEGLGGASARNFGLTKAQGKYISILDSDDFFELDMLEKAVRKAEETNAEIVVFGGYEYDDKNGNTYKVASILNEKAIPEKIVFSYRDCANKIYQISQGMAWNKLYRRTFISKYNIQFQRIKYTDDAYFTFAYMVLADKITVLKEYLCYYRVNTGINQTAGLANYPDSAYLPYIELKKSLIHWGIYDVVKRSFINCAVSFMRYFYDRIERYTPFCYLHDKYRNEVFNALDINVQTIEKFNDKRTYIWCKQVMEHSAGELLFKTARSYGSENTTSILRFPFPYDKISRHSKIVIVGAGIMGRHYYSQVILSGYCDVVSWVEQENPFQLSYIQDYSRLRNITFDYALIAYAQPRLIENAISYLKNIGTVENKIILGGTYQ